MVMKLNLKNSENIQPIKDANSITGKPNKNGNYSSFDRNCVTRKPIRFKNYKTYLEHKLNK